MTVLEGRTSSYSQTLSLQLALRPRLESRVSSDRNACSHCSKGRILQVYIVYMKFSKNLQTFANLWVALYRYNRLQQPTFCVSSAGLCRCSMYSIAYLSFEIQLYSIQAWHSMAKPNPWLCLACADGLGANAPVTKVSSIDFSWFLLGCIVFYNVL